MAGSIAMEVIHDGDEPVWLGLAFSEAGAMVGSDAVIGTPDDGVVQKYALGGKDPSAVEPVIDGRQTLADASIAVDEYGQTIMKFTKLLAEDGEIEVFSSGGNAKNTVLFAHGMGGDGFGHHGGNRMAFEIGL